MKDHLFSVETLQLLFFIVAVITLGSCSSTSIQKTSKQDPGNDLLAYISMRKNSEETNPRALVGSFFKKNLAIEVSEEEVSTILDMYQTGILRSVAHNDLSVLSKLKESDKGKISTKFNSLLLLYPTKSNLIIENIENSNLLDKAEIIDLAVKRKLDPTLIFGASASEGLSNVVKIGWGGGGAFTSVVEFNKEVYASSDVTGVWKFDETNWIPIVKGLTNYNVTGLLVHNNKLLAATENQILKLSNDSVWSPIGLKLKTFRSETLQLYSIAKNGTVCFAALEPKLACINSVGATSTTPLAINKLRGIYFDQNDDDYFFAFYGKELYRINMTDGSHTLEYSFPSSILRILKLGKETPSLIVTQKGIYELGSFVSLNLDLKNKTIVNVLSDSTTNGNHLIALGSTWNTSFFQLSADEYSLTIGAKIAVHYNAALPFRSWRKSMTKPLGIPGLVQGKVWFSDYWGIYGYDAKTATIYEKSKDASNVVGTDIHIANNKLYITSMDNGLVSMQLDKPNVFKSEFPNKSTDWQLAGHAWSVDSNGEKVFATLSPWNVPEDYIVSVDTADNSVIPIKIDNSTSRNSAGSFWGQSYARKLVISDDIYAYKDGSTGGLFKLTNSNSPSKNSTEYSAGQLLYSTDKNRVYRALTKFKNSLVSYHIDDTKRLIFHDIVSGEVIKSINAPVGLWAFNLEVIDDSLYLLGSRGGAIIYRFDDNDETFTEIVNAPSASAFMVIREAPDDSFTLAGAIDWSRKPNGKVLLRHENENDWIDITCLMSNESGAVDIEFTEDGEYVYILQQVGSVIKIEVSQLQSYRGCAN